VPSRANVVAGGADAGFSLYDSTFQRIPRRQPVLGIIVGILGGALTHLAVYPPWRVQPSSERFHPAGIILSTIGAIVVLYVCIKLKIHFPRVG